jgi:hypothetical protein
MTSTITTTHPPTHDFFHHHHLWAVASERHEGCSGDVVRDLELLAARLDGWDEVVVTNL